MKKILVVLVLFTTISTGAQAQTAAKAMFFELGGPGIASFNFDWRFNKKEDGLGARVGFGGFSIQGSGAIFIPVGLNYLIGKDGKNYFELGANVTPVFIKDEFEGNFNSTFGTLNFGYRLQPKNGGFFFRAAINPVFGEGFFIPYYGAVAFGYKF